MSTSTMSLILWSEDVLKYNLAELFNLSVTNGKIMGHVDAEPVFIRLKNQRR